MLSGSSISSITIPQRSSTTWLTLKGVASREAYYHDMAEYYDLIVGLHLDEAMREVALSALKVPTIIVLLQFCQIPSWGHAN